MQIINATKSMKSVMASNGDMISIPPGGLSKMIIATPTLISAAIKLGTEKEIGIILTTSYEMEQARKVTASVPYLYTEVDEAKSKLLDPKIDYLGTLNANKVNYQIEVECAKKDEEIKELKDKLQKLESEKSAPTTLRVAELEETLKQLESRFKEVQGDRDKKVNLITDYESQINNLTSNLNQVRSDYGELTQLYSVAQKSVEESKVEVENLKSELGGVKSELVRKSEMADNLNEALKEATDTIESMKSTFNSICKKFNIIKTESGEFIQQTSESAE